jgi:hypothetical protein
MPVSHPHKTIFIHIPKTAGTSVEAVLGMHGDKTDVGITPYFNQTLDVEHLYGRQIQHMTAPQLKRALNDDGRYHAYFKFAIVRNPWDRLVSALAWTDQKWARGEELSRAEFEEKVRASYTLYSAWQRSAPGPGLPPYLLPQYLYVFGDASGREVLVDFIARYESLPSDWQQIAARIGINEQLPCRMKSHHGSYREYYSRETRDIVAQMYAADARLFSYEF